MVCAAWRGTDVIVGWEEENEGDVLVQLNHLVTIQLVLLCILRGGGGGGGGGGLLHRSI